MSILLIVNFTLVKSVLVFLTSQHWMCVCRQGGSRLYKKTADWRVLQQNRVMWAHSPCDLISLSLSPPPFFSPTLLFLLFWIPVILVAWQLMFLNPNSKRKHANWSKVLSILSHAVKETCQLVDDLVSERVCHLGKI